MLPVVTFTLTLLAHVSRLTRSSMIELLDSAYVKVARSRGPPERVVIVRHTLRDDLLPTITVPAQDFGFLIGGIVAVEAIFAYPGIGRPLFGSQLSIALGVIATTISMALGVLFVPPIARVTRGVALDLMSEDFVESARSRGERT